jgi:preprotein translocase subunit SecB
MYQVKLGSTIIPIKRVNETYDVKNQEMRVSLDIVEKELDNLGMTVNDLFQLTSHPDITMVDILYSETGDVIFSYKRSSLSRITRNLDSTISYADGFVVTVNFEMKL